MLTPPPYTEEERRRFEGMAVLACIAKVEFESGEPSPELQRAAGRFARWVVLPGDHVIVPGFEGKEDLTCAEVLGWDDNFCLVIRRREQWAVPWEEVRVAWRHSDDHFRP